MEHLVANSGLQFITQEIELSPMEGYLFPETNRQLRYTFFDSTFRDPVLDTEETVFDYCIRRDDKCIRLQELLKSDSALVCNADGNYAIEKDGLPEVRADLNANLFDCITKDVYTISNLSSYKLKLSNDSQERVDAFRLLLDKWLPMPMFCQDFDGGTNAAFPMSWCRLKMNIVSEDKKCGVLRLRLVWAFDTSLGDDFSVERPVFFESESDSKVYTLCNRAGSLFKFFFTSRSDGAGCVCSNATEYLSRLCGIDLSAENLPERFKFVGYYIYLVNLLRLKTSFEVTLYRKDCTFDIPVDMVLDIGNSRTCGTLFENGSFSSGKMLELRNLSRPWITDNRSFDMRLVFRKADFGNDIITEDESLFAWKSFVRVGQEAKDLIYNAYRYDGLSQKTTDYSSPKRYLWDNKPFSGKWEFLVSNDDPLNVRQTDSVYISGLSKLFGSDGSYTGASQPSFGQDCKYSRSSLMTFVFIEIFQQAMMQINSVKFRNASGNIDCRRVLRNVIITAPTAMPLVEQQKLRQCAVDAYNALMTLYAELTPIRIVPSPLELAVKDDSGNLTAHSWTYDEATASQFVYLYAEIAQKYNGEAKLIIEAKGKKRTDLADTGYDQKALTIGSIDIGAGTTDLMICAYENMSEDQAKLKPVPLFWDSFYLAGDDIIKNIILRIIIEGNADDDSKVGSIRSVLLNRMLMKSDAELRSLKSANKKYAFRKLMDDILNASDKAQRRERIVSYVDNLIKDFFGTDSGNMDLEDRRCRSDFNTQVSVPIAQKLLDLLHSERPSRVYSFNELFDANRPGEHLLQHFEDHFGFSLEEIQWRYSPDEVAAQVRSTMEPLMKQLSIVLSSFGVDVLILAGRPSSLPPIAELFLKYYPVSPDRVISLNNYNVGSWYPFANPEGYFYDQKSVVAVGAMVGYLASTSGFRGITLDFSELISKMTSTANYIGKYDPDRFEVRNSVLTPRKGSVSLTVDSFPYYLGCKQLDASFYQARPLYAIYNHSGKTPLSLQIERSYSENKEQVKLNDVYDTDGNSVRLSEVELVQQSVSDDCFWMDNGAFKFLK